MYSKSKVTVDDKDPKGQKVSMVILDCQITYQRTECNQQQKLGSM